MPNDFMQFLSCSSFPESCGYFWLHLYIRICKKIKQGQIREATRNYTVVMMRNCQKTHPKKISFKSLHSQPYHTCVQVIKRKERKTTVQAERAGIALYYNCLDISTGVASSVNFRSRCKGSRSRSVIAQASASFAVNERLLCRSGRCE